jgi:golgi SNAP receptor complex member 1
MTEVALAPRKKSKMWEQLKKDARKLEGELEMKLSHYARLPSGMDPRMTLPSSSHRTLQGASQMHSEITSLLKRLQEVHSAMEVDVSGSDVRHHTVARHQEILQDFSQEFRRLSAQIDQVSLPLKLSALLTVLLPIRARKQSGAQADVPRYQAAMWYSLPLA